MSVLDLKTQKDIDKIITLTFKSAPDAVALLVSGQWLSESAMKSGGRPSQQADRVNAGVGTVYIGNKIVASIGNLCSQIAKALY